MLVECPECGKQYKFPDEKIKSGGVKVKCKACEHVFSVTAEEGGGNSFVLHGPDGETLGPFPLETVKARIQVGEVTRAFQIAPEGGDAIPIDQHPELAGVDWPEPAADAGEGDDFGFDEDLGGGDLGGDAFGFDDEAPGEAPAASGPEPEGDDFGFGDDDLGGDAFDLGGDEPAPAGPPAGAGGDADLGGDDPTGDLGGDDDDLGEDFDFGDFTDEDPAAAGDGGDAWEEPAAGGGDALDDALGDELFGDPGDLDPTGPSDEPAPASSDSNSDEDQLAALFDEGGDEAPAGDPLGGTAPGADHDELDDAAFDFADDDGAGDDVFYDEDFDADFEEEVERQVAGDEGEADDAGGEGTLGGGDEFSMDDDSPADLFGDDTPGDMDFGDDEVGSDDELITTLEQLSKKEAPRTVPVWTYVVAPLVLVGALAAAVFFLPQTLRSVPGLGPLTLTIHETLGTEFHRAQILSEVRASAEAKIRRWTPSSVRAGVEEIQRVLSAEPELAEVHILAVQSKFFLEALAGAGTVGVSGLNESVPLVSAYLWALGAKGNAPGAGTPEADRKLLEGWRSFRKTEIQAALTAFTAPANPPMPQALFLALASAAVHADLGEELGELEALQRALEAAPQNPWIAVRFADVLWNYDPRPAEVHSVLSDVSDKLDQLGPEQRARYHVLMVRAEIGKLQMGAAMRQVNTALKELPNNVTLLTLKGMIHVIEKNWADANLVLEQARQIDPGDVEARIAHAKAKVGIGEMGEAIALMAETVRHSPGSLDAQRNYIQLLIDANRLDEAEQAYQDAIERHPDSADLVRLGADVALKQNDVAEAQKRLSRFQDQNPNDVAALLKLSEINLQRGYYGSAEDQLRKLLERDPENVDVYLKLGESLLEQEKFEEALEVLLEALGQDTKNAELYMLLGRAYIELDRIEEAQEMLTESQKLAPNMWRTQMLYGRINLIEEKYSEAALTFGKAIEYSNNAIEPRMWLAKTYEQSNRPGKALEEYREILKLDPDNVFALRKVVEGEMMVDNWKAAESLLSQWLEAEPGESEPYLLMGRVRVGEGDLEAAIEILDRGTKRFSGNAQMHSELGWAHLKAGHYDAARRHLGKAADINPGDGQHQVRLGFLYKELDRSTEAQRSFQRAIRLGGLTAEEKQDAELALEALQYKR